MYQTTKNYVLNNQIRNIKRQVYFSISVLILKPHHGLSKSAFKQNFFLLPLFFLELI